jgi:polysaccharide export outer membrane protein
VKFRSHRFRAVLDLLLLLVVPAVLGAQEPGATPPAYLQPGDVVRINVWQKPQLSGEFSVAPDSTLVHPLYREVKVGGLPLATAEQNLIAFLATYEGPVRLSFEPLFQVAFSGEVMKSGIQAIPAGLTVAQAIAMAGGTGERAKMAHIQLIRGGTVTRVDLTNPSDAASRITIRSGDQIRVPRRVNYVTEVITPIGSVSGAFIAILSLLLN